MSEAIEQGGVHLGVATDSGPFADLQRLRWDAAVPFAEQALGTHQRRHHHQPQPQRSGLPDGEYFLRRLERNLYGATLLRCPPRSNSFSICCCANLAMTGKWSTL